MKCQKLQKAKNMKFIAHKYSWEDKEKKKDFVYFLEQPFIRLYLIESHAYYDPF